MLGSALSLLSFIAVFIITLQAAFNPNVLIRISGS